MISGAAQAFIVQAYVQALGAGEDGDGQVNAYDHAVICVAAAELDQPTPGGPTLRGHRGDVVAFGEAVWAARIDEVGHLLERGRAVLERLMPITVAEQQEVADFSAAPAPASSSSGATNSPGTGAETR